MASGGHLIGGDEQRDSFMRMYRERNRLFLELANIKQEEAARANQNVRTTAANFVSFSYHRDFNFAQERQKLQDQFNRQRRQPEHRMGNRNDYGMLDDED